MEINKNLLLGVFIVILSVILSEINLYIIFYLIICFTFVMYIIKIINNIYKVTHYQNMEKTDEINNSLKEIDNNRINHMLYFEYIYILVNFMTLSFCYLRIGERANIYIYILPVIFVFFSICKTVIFLFYKKVKLDNLYSFIKNYYNIIFSKSNKEIYIKSYIELIIFFIYYICMVGLYFVY